MDLLRRNQQGVLSHVLYDCSGTSLMIEVFINHEAHPYVLETDGTLDLAELNLQPASIVINMSVTLLFPK